MDMCSLTGLHPQEDPALGLMLWIHCFEVVTSFTVEVVLLSEVQWDNGAGHEQRWVQRACAMVLLLLHTQDAQEHRILVNL